ncbi:S-adenosylmethionine decarboxylase [uncultured Flavobacterium sp.]|uniref:S-adenosylmethionine decarboxylase family protein n=1 Tax=uncultured Flavobacterium sp. TaxID=165435 RepID=UPI0030EB7D36|tara:strand:+ start:105 stop:467 length:363 start_codon:yes stop_codon:yes gene_type:complete
MNDNLNPLGLHTLLTLKVSETSKLINLKGFVDFTDSLLLDFKLEKVGLTSFVFENESFTIAYCLKESHICIHTWPEINTLTLDVYLCNYSQNNTFKVKNLANEFIKYFKAEIIKKTEVER